MKGRLYDNPLTPAPNDFILRIAAEKSLEVAVSRSAVNSGGADISESAMTHAVELWLKGMTYRSCDGFAVNPIPVSSHEASHIINEYSIINHHYNL